MAEQQSTKPRVLIVDDSRVMRESIKRFLKADYECAEAGDGMEAWELLATGEHDFDILITDIAMPRMDGYNLIVKIRDAGSGQAGPHLPIVVITGVEDEITRMRAFACGADSFITKPLSGENLRENVSAMLARLRNKASTPKKRDEATLTDHQSLLLQGEETLARCREEHSSAAILVLDFSREDDSPADDALHQQVSSVLLRTLRDTDLLAPLNARRFAILADETDAHGAALLSKRLQDALGDEQTIAPLRLQTGHVALEEKPRESFRNILELAVQRCEQAGSATALEIDESVLRCPTVDEALAMLERDEPGALLAYAGDLAQNTLPLLEYCNEQWELGLEVELASIREKLREVN